MAITTVLHEQKLGSNASYVKAMLQYTSQTTNCGRNQSEKPMNKKQTRKTFFFLSNGSACASASRIVMKTTTKLKGPIGCVKKSTRNNGNKT